MAEEYAVKLARFPDRVAAIVGKTFTVMGADALERGIADDQALGMIRDLLNELDPTLIDRNKKKRLATRIARVV